MGSTTALNKSGHIVIGWTEASEDEVAALIQKKMDQNIKFFQRKPFTGEEVQITKLSDVVGREVHIHDDDFAKLITDGKASILSRVAYAAGAAVAGFSGGRKITDAREAARIDTYSVRQFAGG